MQKVFQIPDILRRIFISWLAAATLEWLSLPGELRELENLNGLAQMSFTRLVLITCGGTVLFSLLSLWRNTESVEKWSIVCIFAVLAVSVLYASFSWAFLTVCALIEIGLVVYAIRGWNGQAESTIRPKKGHKAWLWITAVLSSLFFLLVSAWTVGRVYSFRCPSYDFGIFSQMFYTMTKTGLPMTTLERDGLLSHFAVHVSPIYYLLLPFYSLIPTPATLQVLQAAVMTSAVIPLWKLGRLHGLHRMQRMLICAMLLLYPAFSGGAGYDIHENCFLTPLILWLFYGIHRRNGLLTFTAAVLTLMVKEDAAVYVAVIALWLTVKALLKKDRGNLITGILMLVGALGWFFLVTGYLAKSGDGVMTYRYENFMYDGSSSLFTVVKAAILHPMKAVFECVDAEKLQFIGLTMVPLLGLPLLTRRYERYILLIPYLLVNLMSDYRYQHDIFFQYSFGSTPCLIYLAVVNLADFKINRKRTLALTASVIVSAVCFGIMIVPTAVRPPIQAVQFYDSYQDIRDALSQIPEDASVTAHSFYTTFLSRREVLYDVRYASKAHLLESDYVVLNKTATGDYQKYATGGEENGYENLVRLLEEKHYELLTEETNGFEIYKKP